MEEAKISIDKFNEGDKTIDFNAFMWVWKITARDLIVGLVIPLFW